MSRRPLVLVAAAVLLCAGCSAADADSNDKAESAKASADQQSAVRKAVAALRQDSASFDQEIEIEGDGQVYLLSIAGGFDFAADRGHLEVDLPGGAIDHSEQVFADGKIYLNGVQGSGVDNWGVMARDKAEAHYLLRAPLNDPEHLLQQIAAMRKVSRQGEEKVEGVRTVHYRGILDHRTTTLRTAPDVRAKIDRTRDALGGDLPVFADAWIDGKGRLARVRLNVNMSGAGVTSTMTLSDVGKPVRVTVPRPADTTPVTEVSGVLNG
ncbi:LppX_LprAFG lipoprotein [Streptomyces nigra]